MNISRAATAGLLSTAAAIVLACGDSSLTERQLVVDRLDAFVESLEQDPPTQAELPARIGAYLDRNPTFFGSTVTTLDASGQAVYAPYLYRLGGGGLGEKDLAAVPGYDIDAQAWLREPIEADAGVWTEPYFDEGGGNIWMVTRSVPVHAGGRIVAVATTDLPVAPPSN